MVTRTPRVGPCAIADCGAEIHAQGLCHKHYRRKKAAERRVNLCACGCGKLTEFTFVWGHHTRLFPPEEQQRRGLHNDGSAQRDPEGATSYRKIRGRHEHRIVAERVLGRKLADNEIVHHKDGNRRNNAPENLEVMTQAEHAALHARERRAKK